MGKRKKIIIILTSIMVMAAISGTYAAFTASTKTTHEVSTRALKIALRQVKAPVHDVEPEPASARESAAGFRYKGMPGDTVNEKIYVENTETEDCYIRVTINRSWADEEGKKVFAAGESKKELRPETIAILSDTAGWIVTEDAEDPEVIYCYYKSIVPGGKATSNVIEGFTLLKNELAENSNEYAGLSVSLLFEADAVQAYAAQEAIRAEWGVEASFDSGNHITNIQEQ